MRYPILLGALVALTACAEREGPKMLGCTNNFVHYDSAPRALTEAALVVYECDETSPRTAAIVMYPSGMMVNVGSHTRIATVYPSKAALDSGALRLDENRAPRLSFRWISDTELEIQHDPAATMVNPMLQAPNATIRYSPPLPAAP